MRELPEWIGKTDDSTVPARDRLRVFEKFGGICQLSNRKIMPEDEWDLDHVKSLWRGGEHRETNLHPVLRQPHREIGSRAVRTGQGRSHPKEAPGHLARIESKDPRRRLQKNEGRMSTDTQLRQALSNLLQAYSACNGEDHPAYREAEAA